MFRFDSIFEQIPRVQNSDDWYAEKHETGTKCVKSAATNEWPIMVTEILAIEGFQYTKIWLQMVEHVHFFDGVHDFVW